MFAKEMKMKTALMILGAVLMASIACTAVGNAPMKIAGGPLIQAHRGNGILVVDEKSFVSSVSVLLK